MKIAILNDLHYGASEGSARKCEYAKIFLKRAVRRMNRLIRPDVVLVLGDVLNDGEALDAEERLHALRRVLDRLDAPYLAIPGNHDPATEDFYAVFARPADIEDIGGVRFLPFLDAACPGYNAKRSPADIDRFAKARSNFSGPIVSLQHVNLFPPARGHAPYNLVNAPEVIRAMKAHGVSLSVSGHYHAGLHDIYADETLFVNAPAFCEAPFSFLEIELDAQGQAQTALHTLAMPKKLQCFDTHMHTQLAYCSDDVDAKTNIALMQAFGLAGIALTEHSGHLYFSRQQYRKRNCFREGMPSAQADENRMQTYLDLKTELAQEHVLFGLEADCDFQGNLLIAPQDRKHFPHIVGAVHALPHVPDDPGLAHTVHDDFLFLTEKILQQGVVSLAHPFRIFRRSKLPTPEELFVPMAELLRQYGVAAEINFHTNEPPVAFIRTCLDRGVKFTLASDAHDLSEIGDFAYHIALLQEAGFDGDLADIIQPPGVG